MGGSFSRTGESWRKDWETLDREREKAGAYRARVVGRRVEIVDGEMYGEAGVVVDARNVNDIQVRLDSGDAYWFSRDELQAVAVAS